MLGSIVKKEKNKKTKFLQMKKTEAFRLRNSGISSFFVAFCTLYNNVSLKSSFLLWSESLVLHPVSILWQEFQSKIPRKEFDLQFVGFALQFSFFCHNTKSKGLVFMQEGAPGNDRPFVPAPGKKWHPFRYCKCNRVGSSFGFFYCNFLAICCSYKCY
jgi:hypothetical protein